MANRRDPKRKTKIGGQFAPRLIEMLESPAHRVLSLSARRALDRIEVELAHHGGTDNGNLPCTFDDFVRFGIERHCIGPALNELESLGFIEVKVGRGGNGEFRQPNRYRLTYRHHGHNEPTHEWRRIKSVPEARRIAKEVRRLPRR